MTICPTCGMTVSDSSWKPYRVVRSIDRDPEVAAFIVKCSETMIVRQIRAACLERFGSGRTPSQAAIYRYQASRSRSANPGDSQLIPD